MTRAPSRLTGPVVPFTSADWRDAVVEYPCINCGPTALCGILGLRPLDVLPSIPNYRDREYTNPSMMATALHRLGVRWHERDDSDCDGHTLTNYGLVRIQWEGPWTAPGANPRWAYRQTHWIGAAVFSSGPDAPPMQWVFDVNCGWRIAGNWADTVVRDLTRMYPRATGGWFATHRWEIEL